MQNDTHARTHVIDVELPASLTEPLPDDASTLTIAARTAAVTALGVDGVHHLGSLVERAADQVRSRLGRAGSALGVTVDDADTALDVRVSLVVEYPQPVTAVAAEVRSQVARAVGEIAQRPAHVEVHVTDVHGPFDDEPSVIDRASDAVRDATDQVRATASEAASDVSDQVRETAGRARTAGTEALQRASETAAAAADSAQATARHARDATATTATRVSDAAGAHTAAAAGATQRAAADVADRAAEAADAARDAAVSAADQVHDVVEAEAEAEAAEAERAEESVNAKAERASDAADEARTAADDARTTADRTPDPRA
ncbi:MULTISPECIES: Asp23/Gls24 family envelope stress response protein [unclassified Curtobacterium]|uniref:Asp23/Gls24 family envelope stress response protein n=1 Tax=unclassified Curtobacterium TaxID=257496 RepID=UPI00226B4C5B|nr:MULTISPECIES: Asp23/Gls24 family envelope stress response protein [unclassified Curtobacterium]